MMHMPVGGKDGKRPARPVRQFQETVIRQDREVKHHLIHLCITVSPDTEQIILHRIQHGDHFLRRIAFRQVVPRSVIENIPQQEQTVRPFSLICIQHLPAVQGRPVYI